MATNKSFDKKIVVYGGAFNPPHIGHAVSIESIIRLFPCDEVWVMPSTDRQDKHMTATGQERIEMLNIMIKEQFPDSIIPILVSDIEIRRSSMTTTFETDAFLKKEYLNYDFYWEVGSDIVPDIKDKWFKGKEIFENGKFIVTKRAGSAIPKDLPRKATVLFDKQTANVELSSTFIRRLLSRGYSGLPYITKGVAEYIKQNKLYK